MTNEIPNGKIHHDEKPPEPNVIVSTLYTILDIIVFLSVSIGYIIQDLYYIAFGYPEKELKDEVALITGGGGGLGRLLTQRLSDMGTKVVVWDINQEGIDETVKMINEAGGFCKGYIVDISKKDEVYKAADIVRREVGDVTLLINNAGVVSGRWFMETPDYLIERSFNVNAVAHFWTTKAFLPSMIEKNHGHIVTVASLAGHVGISKLVDYCASKFAAVGFDEALRMELEVRGHDGVKTSCICPYFIQATGMFDDVNARWVPKLNSNEVAERIIKAIKTNEKLAVIPGYLKFLVSLKWVFPWGCASGFLKRLVPDASPTGSPSSLFPPPARKQSPEPETIHKENNNLIKSASLLVQRTPSVGERVL